MKDDVIFRRRQRLKYHFVHISKVLLYGYKKLSDGAKITYQVIDGFDWESKETGRSKGYAFPAIETIAEIRGTSLRSIYRHVSELIKAQLLTREQRRYKTSILYIEDISQEEIDRYLAEYVDNKPLPPTHSDLPQKSRNDKNGNPGEHSETTKMAILKGSNLNLPKEEEVKKKNVNVVEKRQNETLSMQQVLSNYQPATMTHQGRGHKSNQKLKRDYLAQTLAEEFQDPKGMGCYRRIADKLPESTIFRLMAEVKETARLGNIRSRPAAVFVAAAKEYASNHGIKLGFGKSSSPEVSAH